MPLLHVLEMMNKGVAGENAAVAEVTGVPEMTKIIGRVDRGK